MAAKVFSGIKVTEFAWIAVGPQTSRYLADHGATVVRLESHTHYDMSRSISPFPGATPEIDGSMFYGKYNANKYNATLDLNHPRGPELAWKFINWADILIESFRPGTMKRWGLDYESVHKVKPDLIYVSTSMQGQSGPHAQYAGFGPMLSAISGFGEISGWPGCIPSPPYGAYSDFYCQRFNATAIIAALENRDRTGKGQWVEQSQLETSIHMIAPLIMDYSINGHVSSRQGNRFFSAAPHGVYPCKGDDRWIAIAASDDDQRQAFCSIIGGKFLLNKSKLKTLAGWKENENELDELIAGWTVNNDADYIEDRLQAAGIPSSVVKKNSDLFNDIQLKHRNFYVRLNHPVIGNPSYQQQADFILSKTPREITMPSPCLGEHNDYVYRELLGMTGDEIADHIIDGSITTELPSSSHVSANF